MTCFSVRMAAGRARRTRDKDRLVPSGLSTGLRAWLFLRAYFTRFPERESQASRDVARFCSFRGRAEPADNLVTQRSRASVVLSPDGLRQAFLKLTDRSDRPT